LKGQITLHSQICENKGSHGIPESNRPIWKWESQQIKSLEERPRTAQFFLNFIWCLCANNQRSFVFFWICQWRKVERQQEGVVLVCVKTKKWCTVTHLLEWAEDNKKIRRAVSHNPFPSSVSLAYLTKAKRRKSQQEIKEDIHTFLWLVLFAYRQQEEGK
jgi:hypothetical protein